MTRDRNGNDNPGRDHNNKAFSIWLAGGGVKGGTVYGATDRVRRDGRQGQGPRPRPARDDPASARLRPHEADLSLQRPRLPAHRQLRQRREGSPGVKRDSRSRLRSSADRRRSLVVACRARRLCASAAQPQAARRRATLRRRTSSSSSKARSARSSPTTATSATARPTARRSAGLELDWQGGWDRAATTARRSSPAIPRRAC